MKTYIDTLGIAAALTCLNSATDLVDLDTEQTLTTLTALTTLEASVYIGTEKINTLFAYVDSLTDEQLAEFSTKLDDKTNDLSDAKVKTYTLGKNNG